MDPELIKAAATSSLGVLSLMVLVVSSIALAFFKDADPKIRLAVFVMIFAGAAAFAAAVMMEKPQPAPVPGPSPSPVPDQSSVPQPDPAPAPSRPAPTPSCRIKANGFEKWSRAESIDADSGWRGGGSSPEQYCDGELRARRSVLGDTGEIELVNTSEDSRDENPPFNVRRYRYTCTFTQRTDPIYKLAPNPACAAGE